MTMYDTVEYMGLRELSYEALLELRDSVLQEISDRVTQIGKEGEATTGKNTWEPGGGCTDGKKSNLPHS